MHNIAGIYRKLHPAINKSIYEAGDKKYNPHARSGGI